MLEIKKYRTRVRFLDWESNPRPVESSFLQTASAGITRQQRAARMVCTLATTHHH